MHVDYEQAPVFKEMCLTVRHISGQQKKAAFTIMERGNGLCQ